MANGPTEQRWKVLESGMDNEIYSQKLDLHGIPGVGMIQSALLQKNMADSSSSGSEAAKGQSLGTQDQQLFHQQSL
jgi:hypothetical protein